LLRFNVRQKSHTKNPSPSSDRMASSTMINAWLMVSEKVQPARAPAQANSCTTAPLRTMKTAAALPQDKTAAVIFAQLNQAAASNSFTLATTAKASAT
jgi:hypothetical protein